MKIPRPLQLCFTLFLTPLWQVSQAAAINGETLSSYCDNTTVDESIEKEFSCSWDCVAMESYVRESINLALIEEKKVIRLRFSYMKEVDLRCVNNSQKLSRLDDTYWKIWLVNNNIFSEFASDASKRLSFFLDATFSEQMVRTKCTLRRVTRSRKRLCRLNPHDYSEELIRSVVVPMGNFCNSQTDQSNLQRCIMVSEYAGDLSTWEEIINFLFLLFFVYYSPLIVCLFSTSQVTRHGFRQITVEGPSPVGLRRLIGNYFFSVENTFWHRMRKFIMRVILLPIIFLVPAMFVEYLLFENALSQSTNVKVSPIIFRPFLMVCYCCYFIKAFIDHFIVQISDHTVFCDTEDKSFPCTQRELPEIMVNHMRFGCKVLIRMWTFSWNVILKEVKFCFLTCPSFVISLLFLSKFIWFIIYLLAVILSGLLIILLTSFVTVLLLCLVPPSGLLCLYATYSDVWKTVNIKFLHPRFLFTVRWVVALLYSCILSFSLIAVISVLKYAAVGIIIFPQFVFAFVLRKENLPFVTCCVLVSFYVWINYRSFTRKYKDLAVKLLDQQHGWIARTEANTELNKQWVFPEKSCTIEKMKRIPQELFDLACEEIMPLREAICDTFLKAYLSVLFVFLTYSLTMLLSSSQLTITFVMLVVALLPKFFMYLYKRQDDLKPVGIDEKVRHVVEVYIKTRFSPHRDRAEKGHVSSQPLKDENSDTPVILDIILVINLQVLYWYFYLKF